MIFEPLGANVDRKAFENYLHAQLGPDIAAYLEWSTHPRAIESRVVDDDGWWVFDEGTIRAAAFAILRMRLPRTWCVEAEVLYPESRSAKGNRQRADLLVWTPRGEPIVIEVKPDDGKEEAILADLKKLQKHVSLKSSLVKRGYLLFSVAKRDLAKAEAEWADWRKKTGSVEALLIPVTYIDQ